MSNEEKKVWWLMAMSFAPPVGALASFGLLGENARSMTLPWLVGATVTFVLLLPFVLCVS
jgi:hypothetical protein